MVIINVAYHKKGINLQFIHDINCQIISAITFSIKIVFRGEVQTGKSDMLEYLPINLILINNHY